MLAMDTPHRLLFVDLLAQKLSECPPVRVAKPPLNSIEGDCDLPLSEGQDTTHGKAKGWRKRSTPQSHS